MGQVTCRSLFYYLVFTFIYFFVIFMQLKIRYSFDVEDGLKSALTGMKSSSGASFSSSSLLLFRRVLARLPAASGCFSFALWLRCGGLRLVLTALMCCRCDVQQRERPGRVLGVDDDRARPLGLQRQAVQRRDDEPIREEL